LFIAINEAAEYGRAIRVTHEREQMRAFLKALPAGCKIALETSGSYYWLVDEMERAGTSGPVGECADGETADGRAAQNRRAGCARVGDVIAQRDSAAGVDSAG